jgi:hypothetical protein
MITIRRIAVLLPLVCSCATVRATQQEPREAPTVAHAPTFYVKPLRFNIEQSWENPETWARHVNAWTQAYWDGVYDYARSKLKSRSVQMLGPGQTVTDGIIVDANVSSIRRSTAGMLGEDHLESEVVFIDARSGERLLAAKVDSTSERIGPEGWTFGGRIKFCSLNLAKGVVEAMSQGRFPD